MESGARSVRAHRTPKSKQWKDVSPDTMRQSVGSRQARFGLESPKEGVLRFRGLECDLLDGRGGKLELPT